MDKYKKDVIILAVRWEKSSIELLWFKSFSQSLKKLLT